MMADKQTSRQTDKQTNRQTNTHPHTHAHIPAGWLRVPACQHALSTRTRDVLHRTGPRRHARHHGGEGGGGGGGGDTQFVAWAKECCRLQPHRKIEHSLLLHLHPSLRFNVRTGHAPTSMSLWSRMARAFLASATLAYREWASQSVGLPPRGGVVFSFLLCCLFFFSSFLLCCLFFFSSFLLCFFASHDCINAPICPQVAAPPFPSTPSPVLTQQQRQSFWGVFHLLFVPCRQTRNLLGRWWHRSNAVSPRCDTKPTQP